ncbi:GNAT family N-acetyltransferase [Mesorhizobium sp. CU2]|uniref:GNAT family N-acetyltransferase n=1 Tax=unclassified Mesorhizobium TaxID=325217 RepID=UPI00112B9795|nr:MULTISPECIES: GNAT family N-acetyltransferase [unclassified Mesorhizobium]TPN86467.1 GNAT family N-acetyltransferase [Mesorhizobium sp. CU3]TPO19902.1 GNAT family N-acetyltransferase [Mesorhizobium sp. CU2]
MTTTSQNIEAAIEVFVRGYSAGRSRTFPYEASRVGPLWLMRDAERKNARDYRGEEWIVHDVAADEADAIVRRYARPRFAVSVVIANDEPDRPVRSAYKALGYRLLRTEGFFVHPLRRVPDPSAVVSIERVRTAERAAQLAKIIRRQPIADDLLGDGAPFRQYVALDGDAIVGRVRSVDAAGATWCEAMFVEPSHRRRGIGQALLAKMLRDDRAHGSRCSVLMATHAGAMLYPRMGYEQIGTLLIFAPKKQTSL